MNESKLLKNHNKCPMITTNLNEKKMQNSHSFVTCPNFTFKKGWASKKKKGTDLFESLNPYTTLLL